MLYNSANRDYKVFTDPYKFEVLRSLQPAQVGFGSGGPHFCLGANLARREITVMFDEIRRRMPTLHTVSGPIPLPTHKRIFTVLRSPHVNKTAREQFQLCSYKRLMDIYSSSSKTIDALMKLELPSGVDVEIKV